MSRYSADWDYQQRRAALKRRCQRDGIPCWLCGRPFPWDVDQATHPLSFTADHLLPISKGGRMTGALRPAHRACNSRRGAGDRAKRQPLAPVKTTIEWT